MPIRASHLVTAFCLSSALSASAHLSYPASRDFGTFTGASPQSVTIAGQTTKIFGWADGTDSDFAKQDDQRYLKLSLSGASLITISITSLDPVTLFPAFSLYSGLGHAAKDPADLDYDGSNVTQAYLASLGAPVREGAFDALHSWKIGSDLGTSPADLATFTYIGHAADGTPANYGTAPGINGDGLADGTVTATFSLPAGDYTLVIGGANYFNQTDATAKGFNATISSIPEPCCGLFLSLGVLLASRRRRRSPR